MDPDNGKLIQLLVLVPSLEVLGVNKLPAELLEHLSCLYLVPRLRSLSIGIKIHEWLGSPQPALFLGFLSSML